MSFSWLAIWQGLPYLLQGAGLTIVISATAMLLALGL
ncbi:MAG: glutamine ABC transporter permease GlnP, partial [candidate division NC10 bacterium]|nr:glutamine ABC transporter permease GlnP [candidate division NC10 bacterium]